MEFAFAFYLLDQREFQIGFRVDGILAYPSDRAGFIGL